MFFPLLANPSSIPAAYFIWPEIFLTFASGLQAIRHKHKQHKKKTLIILATALTLSATVPASAQKRSGDAQGSITPEMLAEIRKGYEGTASDKALKNALNTNSINVLAANSENLAMIDTHFSDQVKTKGRTNQKSSAQASCQPQSSQCPPPGNR